jgi:uncharacterized protein with PQ loop repeat
MSRLYQYIFTKEKITVIDKLMMVACTIHPLTALPQVFAIYHNQAAENVSLITWLGFMALGILFLLYAIAHVIKPMIVNQILWFSIDTAIVIGVLVYG